MKSARAEDARRLRSACDSRIEFPNSTSEEYVPIALNQRLVQVDEREDSQITVIDLDVLWPGVLELIDRLVSHRDVWILGHLKREGRGHACFEDFFGDSPLPPRSPENRTRFDT